MGKATARQSLALPFSAVPDAPLGDLPPIQSFSAADLAGLKTMLKARVNSPLTSSAGRLFDAVAALLGLRQIVRFEGQAAMELEFAIAGSKTEEAYPFDIASQERPGGGSVLVVDWGPIVKGILADREAPVARRDQFPPSSTTRWPRSSSLWRGGLDIPRSPFRAAASRTGI